MRTLAIELPGIGEPETLRAITPGAPEPGPGEAVVRVEATGVSFAEQQMRLGKYYDQPPFPFVPGYDLVGVVERVGAGVSLAPGRRVAALTKTGAWAQRVVLPVADLAPVPDGVDPVDAETAIVNGLTAWRMLHRTARVPSGATIVVLRCGRRRRLAPGPARRGCRDRGDRRRRARPAGQRPGARRDPGGLPGRGRPRPRARAGARRRRRRLRPRRRRRHRGVLADARARRHARLLRQRSDEGRPGQRASARAEAARAAHGLEPPAQRAPCPLLQPLGRQAPAPRAVSGPGARGPRAACSGSCARGGSRRRSPRASP